MEKYDLFTTKDRKMVAEVWAEVYVFINLLKRQDFPEEIAFEMPAFATYRGGQKGNILTLPVYMLERFFF